MKKLFFEAITKVTLGLLLMIALLFLPILTFDYWNAWLLITLLFFPMIIVGFILLFKKPELLNRRLKARETQKEQRVVIALAALMFMTGFIVASLDYKYNLTNVPFPVVIAASIIFVISYILYGEVIRENEYLSRVIEVQENQKVVDTGFYGIVRHPMYLATILMFLSIPIILGSIYSFIIFLIYPFIIVSRIKNEEKVLMKELKGYKEYTQKVKYRLLPYIW